MKQIWGYSATGWPVHPRGMLLGVVGLLVMVLFTMPLRTLQAQVVIPDADTATVGAVQVSPYLAAEIAAGASDVSILVVLKDQPDLAALQVAATTASRQGATTDEARRIARTTFVYQALTAHARQSQADLRAWLDAQNIPYRPHYLINMISVTGGAELVDALRARADVARLDANPQVDTMHTLGAGQSMASVHRWARLVQMPEAVASLDTPYGVAATRAPEVWAMGYTGQGIVVASQDTGVQWDHGALRTHYRGTVGNDTEGDTFEHTYNWLDAIPATGAPDGCAGLDAPCDDNGHGTHTVGTMVGKTDVITYGVAPGAEWIGCRNMRAGVGTPETYTTCFEFFLAPYPAGGDPLVDGRPDLAPHIINNSWGCPPSEGCNKDSLRQVVETVRAAGLMVVASAGNNGGSCSGVIDPVAIYDATFSVGAHDVNGNLAGFSSKGPVTADGSGRLKPDLTAPGVSVLSTYRFSSTTSLSGTSMASPHVAGAVALLWSAAPWMMGEIDLTEQVLLKSATPVFSALCGSDGAEVSPNNAFGYGRLDVADAVELAMQPWEVVVAVVDEMGAPVADAAVTWIDARTGYTRSVMTDVSGSALISPTLAGEYTVEVLGAGGTLALDPVELVNDGVGGEPQAVRFDVVYDEIVLQYPARHYMPGIFLAR